MLKDLTEKERRTHRQIELAIMYSRTNKIANAHGAKDWQKFRKEHHSRAIDQYIADEMAVK